MYDYFSAAFFFLCIWVVVFLLLRQSRKLILWSSLALAHAGPISQYWHLKDYWNPAYVFNISIGNWLFGIEDYLFAFAFAGLCSGVFDVLARKAGEKEFLRFDIVWFIKTLLFGFTCLLAMGALVGLAELNSLHAIVLTFLVGAAVILTSCPRWVWPAVQTAFIVAMVVWMCYVGFLLGPLPGIFDKWWNAEALSGLTFGGVPIEEIVWAWATGLFLGPMVRCCMH